MKNILVPCDFSKPAINAFRLALDVAQQSKGVVHLLHVIEMPMLHDSVLMPVLNFEEQLFKELKENAEEKFSKLIEKYNAEKIKVISSVDFGSPGIKIIDYTEKKKSDIIIMGSHGASGLREVFIGSNAEKIVRKATIPVLVIKDFFKGSITDIVFPNSLDLDNQEDLVMKVKALQSFFKAKLHIVWINTPINFTSDYITIDRLIAFAKRFMLKDYSVHVFNHPDEEEGILRFSKMIKADMIAMGTHGRRGLAHILNGSLAEDIVNHTDKLIWSYKLQPETIEA